MPNPRRIERYGWTPDLPDIRDLCSVEHVDASLLPPHADLTPLMPMPYDQGSLGSCTANAIAGAVEFLQLKNKPAWDFMPSRLFIYYNERVMEGTVGQDSGAMIRDGIKSVNAKGVCKETIWPYDIAKFTQQPPAIAYKNALAHRAVSYRRLSHNLNVLKKCLADGFPFVFGFTVYTAFEGQDVAEHGVLNMPGTGEKILGGHAVLCVGYDDVSQRFIIRNSWGSDWGVHGYFTMPYDYMTNANLTADMWVITRETNA